MWFIHLTPCSQIQHGWLSSLPASDYYPEWHWVIEQSSRLMNPSILFSRNTHKVHDIVENIWSEESVMIKKYLNWLVAWIFKHFNDICVIDNNLFPLSLPLPLFIPFLLCPFSLILFIPYK